MNWDALGAVAELLGAVGVIASLLYLSLQIRQNTKATHLATSHSIAAGVREWSQPLVEDPSLARAFYTGVEDPAELDDDSRARFMQLCLSFFRMFEDVHYQFRHGALEREVWEAYAQNYGLYAKSPGMQTYWKSRRMIFQPAFRDFVDALEPPAVPRGRAFVYEGQSDDPRSAS